MRLRGLPVVVCALGCVLGARGAIRWQESDLDALPLLRLVEEARIRNADDATAGFARFSGMDVDRDGQLYVLDRGDGMIHVYSPTGELLRKLGEPGRTDALGTSMFGVKGDTVWTIEGGRFSRIRLYSRSGALLSNAAVAGVQVALHNRMTGTVLPRMMRNDGRFVGQLALYSMSENAPDNGVLSTDTVRVPDVLFDASGAVVQTLGWRRQPPTEPRTREYIAIGTTARHPIPTPPVDRPPSYPLGDGYVVVDQPRAQSEAPSTVRVTRITLTGDTLFGTAFRYRPLRYTGALLDTIAARSVRSPGGGGIVVRGESQPMQPPFHDSLRARQVIRDRMQFPEFQLPIRSVWQGKDGALWLMREEDPSGTNRWVVLDPQGRPRGRVEFPARTTIVWISGDTVWATQPNQYNVSWLVRYRISQ